MAILPVYLAAEYLFAMMATTIVAVGVQQNAPAIAEAITDASATAGKKLKEIFADPPCFECDKDPCAESVWKVQARVSSLKTRYVEMLADKDNLFSTKPTGKGSWAGHQQAYRNEQTGLGQELNGMPPQCRPKAPPDAEEWADPLRRPPPNQPAPR